MLSKRPRPGRGEIDEAALELLARHGAQILATARRYAQTPEDAEDAYQRGLEILLTKAPTTREDELLPWLKTVVKHEALAIRRQRERHSPVTDDGELGERGTPAAATHDQAERYERLRQGAEALRQLKPQEIRALLLKAEGYSYAEICEITGWTYTNGCRCPKNARASATPCVAAAGIGNRPLARGIESLLDLAERKGCLVASAPHRTDPGILVVGKVGHGFQIDRSIGVAVRVLLEVEEGRSPAPNRRQCSRHDRYP